MYGYIYKTTDKTNNKIYIGKRVSPKFQPNYFGSGLIVYRIREKLNNDFEKMSERFTVEIIDTAESKEELIEKEIFYIDYLDARNPEVGYNLRKGGDCGPGGPHFKGHYHSEETKHHFSETRKGAHNGNYGNRWRQSDELRALHSKLASGEGNGMYGKHHSETAKQHISESRKGQFHGYKFINDGQINKFVKPEEIQSYLDNGWKLGKIVKHK